ncbi:hypothetical protein [Prosthecodimorpha staleyi]|uniref:Gluconate 2-dehydrogenase subunit 3 family protein n=1 Tax=Prosthecodimorpha staleyi TaxID=2840188 RepID=A0A947GJF8_9HYPH|nr:hypothetical protein [Prosthecodimorpha staleyi]MBT9291574.1 hypothetical protein [Prosthecodimorpha staleyi]
MSDPRRTQLFDLLVPGRGPSPAYSAADPAGALIARVLKIRPDLAGVPDRILAALPEAFGPDDVEACAAADRPGFEALLELVFGAYFLSPAVRHAIGYDGQQALTLPRDGFGAEEQAVAMMAAPPRWRDPRVPVDPEASECPTASPQ